MRSNNVKTLIAQGGTAVNAWLSTDSAYAAEVVSHAGFDSVTVDLQHGMMGRDRLVGMLQAISTGSATPLVRPTAPDPDEIGWVLDAGAYGVIVPSVHSEEAARRVVDACYYPPVGRRSFGPSRGLLYGGADYVAKVTNTLMPWVMIESGAALDSLPQILEIPGLFGVYVGPNDLGLDLGEAAGGRIGDRVGNIAQQIAAAAAEHGVAAGIFCADGDEAREFAERGFDLVTPGNDASLLRSAAAQRIARVREGRPAMSAPKRSQGGY